MQALQFHIDNPNKDASVSVLPHAEENGIAIYRISVSFPTATSPAPITLSWEEDMLDTLYVWYPTGGRDHAMHQWFAPTRNTSNFCFGAPILTTVGANDRNTLTVALSDTVTPSAVTYAVKDLWQEDKTGYTVVLFAGSCPAMTAYSVDLRIDRRKVPFYESIRAVSRWWQEDCGYTFGDCPTAAEDALYSTWYNFHQAPIGESILADLDVASALGFKTVILDDGWQFEGPSSGDYATCGDWNIAHDKFPDFKVFADGVHARGMKLMVWFCVPFVGNQSNAYKALRGKFLYELDAGMNCAVLDVRYPEIRAFILDTYKRFLRDYDLDGFKLDFIDSFRPGDLTAPYDPDVMDCETVDAAVQTLLIEIVGELSEIKPGLLFEYRQNYVGPAINRFGNMLRVADCAYDALTNRIGIIDLRLMDYPVAVHSDMLLWSKNEAPILCARQLYNIFFGVPQISVLLADATDAQRALLSRYLSYWNENRDLILHGKLTPQHPESNYTAVTAENCEKAITVLYADLAYTYQGKNCDLLHSGSTDGIVFENPTEEALSASVYDLFGTPLACVTVAPQSIVRLPVPVMGLAEIRSNT